MRRAPDLTCPSCKKQGISRVVDVRVRARGLLIYRRRKCGVCQEVFVTYEKISSRPGH